MRWPINKETKKGKRSSAPVTGDDGKESSTLLREKRRRHCINDAEFVEGEGTASGLCVGIVWLRQKEGGFSPVSGKERSGSAVFWNWSKRGG